jgi:hypothetical protein
MGGHVDLPIIESLSQKLTRASGFIIPVYILPLSSMTLVAGLAGGL